MQRATSIILLVLCLAFSMVCFSQSPDENLVRRLDDMERIAILKGDTAQLARLMSTGIIVQNPENAIVGFRQIMDRIKSGKINYSSFERVVEKVALINGIAVVMGIETTVAEGETKNAGKTVKRRFTNIWTKEKGNWKLTARQATNVSVE